MKEEMDVMDICKIDFFEEDNLISRDNIFDELMSVGKALQREYNNSNLDFPYIINNFVKILKKEIVPVLFIYKNGSLKRKKLSRESLKPLYEELKIDTNINTAGVLMEEDFLETPDYKKTIFKLDSLEEPIVYKEI